MVTSFEPEVYYESRSLFVKNNGTVTQVKIQYMVKYPRIPSPIQPFLTFLTARSGKSYSGTRITELGFCHDQVATNNGWIVDKKEYAKDGNEKGQLLASDKSKGGLSTF